MHIKVKEQNHFLNLLNDSALAMAYFHNKDMGEFNNQRLIELQNNYKNFGEIKKGVSRMLTPHKEVI